MIWRLKIKDIICGDSREILKTIPDNSIDMVITSPPYNFDMDYDTHKDKDKWEIYLENTGQIWAECYRVLKPGGRMAINLQPDFYDRFPTHHYTTKQCLDLGFLWKCEMIWNKNHYNCPTRQFGSWKSPSSPCIKLSWEYIEVFCKDTIKKTGDKEKIDITREEFLEYIDGMWSFKPEHRGKKFGHPACFPEELPYRLMKMFSYIDDIILDPYNGVGTTTFVAHRLNRQYIGIDLSEEYCKTAKDRLKQIDLFNG